MDISETKSDTQSIDSTNSKMNKIFQNDDIQKAIDQVIYPNTIIIFPFFKCTISPAICR